MGNRQGLNKVVRRQDSLRPCKALTLAFVLSEGRSSAKPARRGLA